MEGQKSAVSEWYGFEEQRGLDGGPLGFLAWSFPQIVGSLAYDAVASGKRLRAFTVILLWGIFFLGLGYALSCLSTLYPKTTVPTTKEGEIKVSSTPMIPPSANWADLKSEETWADPPFVQPAEGRQRELSYWLMIKRVVTLPFNLTAVGYSLAVYALFLLLCDIGPMSIGVFRTFGTNPLITYILHEITGLPVKRFMPEDSPEYWVWGGFGIFFLITYVFVRYLEKNRIYLRM
jgi:hypothetical protein